MTYSAEIGAALASGLVTAEVFVRFKLDDGDFCIWSGFEDILVGDQIFRGADFLSGKMPELEQLVNGGADRVEFELSGVSMEVHQALVEEEGVVDGREIEVLLGFFDADQQLIGGLQYQAIYLMDEVTISRELGDDNHEVRKVTLSVASPLAARSASPNAYYTNQDQIARFPDDRGCEYVSSYQYRVVPWPVFPS